MTQELLIRRARLADISAIWAIEQLSFPTPWSRWSFLAELGHQNSHILVAGPPAPQTWRLWAYLIFWVVLEEMHILNLAVHPDHRRRGIARRLLSAGLAQARKLGAELAWLEVRPSNIAARGLYESFGFKEVGRRANYYDDTHEDALLLTLAWQDSSFNS